MTKVPDGTKVALIDGDIIAYSCGFASDAAAKANGLAFESWGFCKHGVNLTLQSICDAVGADERIIVLTSSSGDDPKYREAMFPAYKAGRTAPKPHHYDAIREYLRSLGAVFSTDGREADDELGILAHDLSFVKGVVPVICTKDKDLDMIAGWHYNFSKTRKGVGLYRISATEGLRFFYKQMLTGDSTDGVPGMFKAVGEKATAKWLAPIDTLTTEEEMYVYVREVYLTLAQKKPSQPHVFEGHNLSKQESLDKYLMLIGTLLWIQNGTGVWMPPVGEMHKRYVERGTEALTDEPEEAS